MRESDIRHTHRWVRKQFFNMKKRILYVNKETGKGLSVDRNLFRGNYYNHISLNLCDLDEENWYRIKGLTVTDDFVEFIIEGLLELEKQIAKENLPDVRQLEFEFMKSQ